MQNEKNVDLQQYTPKRASKWYLVRILIYTAFLIALGYLVVSQLNKISKNNTETIEIEGVTIETD